MAQESKIEVYFKEDHLGTLTKEGTDFVYNSSKDEANAVQKYLLKISSYEDMIGSKNKKSKQIFPFFKEVCNQVRLRQDLMRDAGIAETDDDFSVLEKYSHLLQVKHDFNFRV